MKKPIYVLARRWFQRSYGNTYHSVTVVWSDDTITKEPFVYGYGEQWKETAKGMGVDVSEFPTWRCKVRDVKRKKDL